MVGVVARLAGALVLAGSAALKLATPGSSRASLATFGIEGEFARWVAWGLLVATELGLAGAVAADSDQAPVLAAALMTVLAAALLGALLRGRAGAPCACFGSRSTVGWSAIARNLVLAAGFALLPLLPQRSPSTDEWLGLGLALALLLCLGLAVARSLVYRAQGSVQEDS